MYHSLKSTSAALKRPCFMRKSAQLGNKRLLSVDALDISRSDIGGQLVDDHILVEDAFDVGGALDNHLKRVSGQQTGDNQTRQP